MPPSEQSSSWLKVKDSSQKTYKKGLKQLTVTEFETAAEITNALILDVRSAADFAKGFIPRSVNIGVRGDFAPWVGALVVDVNQPILLVADAGQEEETITRLSRVGFDHVLGFLKGGFISWSEANKEIDTVNRITAEQFKNELQIIIYDYL